MKYRIVENYDKSKFRVQYKKDDIEILWIFRIKRPWVYITKRTHERYPVGYEETYKTVKVEFNHHSEAERYIEELRLNRIIKDRGFKPSEEE